MPKKLTNAQLRARARKEKKGASVGPEKLVVRPSMFTEDQQERLIRSMKLAQAAPEMLNLLKEWASTLYWEREDKAKMASLAFRTGKLIGPLI